MSAVMELSVSPSALVTACYAGDVTEVERILEAEGVDTVGVMTVTHHCMGAVPLTRTPLGAAIEAGHIDVVKLLVEK
jgi:uncharacterized protein YtpQ (UPF0354 family)